MNSFLEFVIEQLSFVENIRYRRMFSGYGMYSNNIFFGMVSKGSFYIKTNTVTSAKYRNWGMKIFAPTKNTVLKNYYEVPIEIIEDRDALRNCVLESLAMCGS